MSDSRLRVQSLVLVALLACSAIALAVPAGATSSGQLSAPIQESGNTAPSESFAVTQGETCYEVTPLGDGSETVESYYNYSIDNDYSSAGTTELQDNQVSNLFVYYGSEGYSLGLVHDQYPEGPDGGTLTMNVTGLPESGEWAVEDDGYAGRDDEFTYGDTWTEIDWKWQDDRTDGGAFRGLTATEDIQLTIVPGFNEDADAWGEWGYSDNEDDRVETWRLYTDDGTTETLDMDRNVTVSRGECGSTPPTATLSASPSNATVDESVTFDASGSSDDAGILDYRWDVDDDGTVERTTETPTLSRTYEAVGEYAVAVTVRDRHGNTDTATATVAVTTESDGNESDDGNETDGGTGPAAGLDAPGTTGVGIPTTLDASDATAADGIESYRWDTDGDGTVEETTTAETFETVYDEAGTVEPAVTVVDGDGEEATASATVEVSNRSDQPDGGSVSVPDSVAVGESFTASLSGIDASDVSTLCWYLDGAETCGTTSVTGSFDEAGRHAVTLVLDDGEDRSVFTYQVRATTAAAEPPTADIEVPETVTVDESATFRATNLTGDHEITHVCWYVDGETGPDGEVLNHTFEETGTHSVGLMLRDSAEHTNRLSTEFQVTAADSGDGDGSDSGDGDDPNEGDEGDDSDGSDDPDDGDDSHDGSGDDDAEDSGGSNDAGYDGGGSMADISGDSGRLFENTTERPTVVTVALNASTLTPADRVEATVWLADTGDIDDEYTLNLTVVEPASGGSNATVVNRTQVTVASGQQRATAPSMVVEEPGQYRAIVGNRSKTFTVRNETTTGDPSTPESDERDGPDSDSVTTMPQSTNVEPTADTDSTATADSTVSGTDEAATTSSDGPGFGFVGGLVALLLSVSALARRL